LINSLGRNGIWLGKVAPQFIHFHSFKKKDKVVPVLNLIKHYAMKAYGGVDV
jgi:hypothetical protein